jgi:hypothetical protein
MPTTDDVRWFKQQFTKDLETAVRGTPFTVDMLTALACQETGEVWPLLRQRDLPIARILELCVGDTIDGNGTKGRKAFPRTKGDLLAKPNGQQMFSVARQALVDMALYVPSYAAVAKKPDKFCHGFGIFQYDLQFFVEEPSYFLGKQYANLTACVGKCLRELHEALGRADLKDKATLSELEMAAVAIAYNTGGFTPRKGLKQGYFDGTKYYGEQFFDYLRLAKGVAVDGQAPAPTLVPIPGQAAVAPPTPVAATGSFYEVEVLESPLRLRSDPRRALDNANVIAHLPDGHIVQAIDGSVVNGFMEVETSLLGAHYRGFASVKFLKPVAGVNTVPVAMPATEPPAAGLVAVYMPRTEGSITKRTQPADAHSLNEPGQPGRVGTTPEALRDELAAIIAWLAVDKAANRRYQPLAKTTFCNIYAHDYCHLAGAYLPRVWWTQAAVESLAQGETVRPLYGKTIDEQRANDLFRWLRDFGLRFGWRQTSTATKLQVEANQGAIGLIAARRVSDGLSGHIVVVVPETEDERARRNAGGDVIAPLQSQAGATNFRYGTGKTDWWKGAQFAESAFWLHA